MGFMWDIQPVKCSVIAIFRGNSTLGQGGTCSHPQIHLLPQIQKLADRSDVISEVPKCSKMQIFRGSASDPAWGAYSAPLNSLADGEGLAAPSQELHPLISTDLRV